MAVTGVRLVFRECSAPHIYSFVFNVFLCSRQTGRWMSCRTSSWRRSSRCWPTRWAVMRTILCYGCRERASTASNVQMYLNAAGMHSLQFHSSKWIIHTRRTFERSKKEKRLESVDATCNWGKMKQEKRRRSCERVWGDNPPRTKRSKEELRGSQLFKLLKDSSKWPGWSRRKQNSGLGFMLNLDHPNRRGKLLLSSLRKTVSFVETNMANLLCVEGVAPP